MVTKPNHLGDRTLAQFRKTAATIAKPPWSLLKAEQFLLKLCEKNEKIIKEKPFNLKWFFEYEMADLSPTTAVSLPPTESHDAPRVITVEKPNAAETLRRRKRLQTMQGVVRPPKRARMQEVAEEPGDADGDVEEEVSQADVSEVFRRPAAAAVAEEPGEGIVGEGADVEEEVSEADASELLRRPAAAAVGRVLRRPAAAKAMVARTTGCTKCRWKQGCAQCKQWAREGLYQRSLDENGIVRIG
jgi:hypothetical protein